MELAYAQLIAFTIGIILIIIGVIMLVQQAKQNRS